MARTMLLLLLSWQTDIAHAADKQATAGELYQQGLKHMRRGYYTKALETFQRVRNYHRDDPVSVKAQLAIADVHFKKGEYDQARFAYEEFATYHPRHEALDYVTWRIGYSIYRRAPRWAGRDQTPTRGAVNVWTGFDKRFPDSKHLEDVDKYLGRGRARLAAKELFIARFYARREAWGAVQGRCERLLQRYGDTESVPETLALLGEAYHAWGRTEEAADLRTRLSETHPDSRYLAKLDKALSAAPGSPPEEQIFVRPFRVRGFNPGGPPQQ